MGFVCFVLRQFSLAYVIRSSKGNIRSKIGGVTLMVNKKDTLFIQGIISIIISILYLRFDVRLARTLYLYIDYFLLLTF